MNRIMQKTIYIETTIPSFYFEERPEPEMVSRRNWTRQWWEDHSKFYDLVISEAVVAELESGDYPNQKQVTNLIRELPVLAVVDEIEEIVEIYIKNMLMPKDDLGDALHLAIASFYKCDFLLTWNCRHLANANKFHHIKRINEKLDLFTPGLVTPLELLSEEE